MYSNTDLQNSKKMADDTEFHITVVGGSLTDDDEFPHMVNTSKFK